MIELCESIGFGYDLRDTQDGFRCWKNGIYILWLTFFPRDNVLGERPFNPMYSGGFSNRYCYNNYGIVHFVFKGVAGRIFSIIMHKCSSVPEDCFIHCRLVTVILEKNRTILKWKKVKNELYKTPNVTCLFESVQYFNTGFKILPTPFQ